jgi:ribosomal-protein-alanine N-acetyltransferase
VTSERVIIRRFAVSDLADFLAYQADPVVRRYLLGEPMSPDEAAGYLAAQAALPDRTLDAWHGYAVQETAGGRVIGDVGVWLSSQPEQSDSGDVGFQFHPAFHGRGYAREAMQAFLPHVFETLARQRITATCKSANTSSRALMQRLGMHLDRESDDEVQYGLSRERWRAGERWPDERWRAGGSGGAARPGGGEGGAAVGPQQ